MPAARFASIAHELRDATATAVWIQWQALGGEAAAPRPASAIVDPEALLLTSLWMKDEDKRLWDFLYGLAEGGSRLLSVQRLKRILPTFPEPVHAAVARFAAAVRHAGNDPRWRGFPRAQTPAGGRPGKWRTPRTRLATGSALMLRLRTAFGVDVRSDALAYLIGRRGVWCTVRDVSRGLGYAPGSVRAACDALTDARLLEAATDGRPARYYAPERWLPLLGMEEAPAWKPWSAVYAFAIRVLEWLHDGRTVLLSDYLASSFGRDLVHNHGAVLRELQLDVPDHRDRMAEAYLPAFEETLAALARWLQASA
ncbi:MAG TPA: hypothetical protein VM716_03945 [Gemmatimonadales bacterium]|nr:hypothetical protein [Gemmatimonadales bacterium]